jgi:thiopeptide-type bacteriocin biosynthesis protein
VYRSVNNALMLRASAFHPDSLGPWPDLVTGNTEADWQPWLIQTMAIPGFSAALAHASPSLALRVDGAMSGNISGADTRRVVLATMRYLLRATSRATPFGLFAGVAPVTADRTGAVRWGNEHRPITRLRAAWLAGIIDRLETDARLRPHLLVRANNLLVHRAGQVRLEYRASRSDPDGAPSHLRIKASRPLLTALDLAAEPIRWADLSGKLAAEQGAPPKAAERLVTQMVTEGLLLTSLRPPSTQTDPLAHLLDELEGITAAGGDPGDALRELRTLQQAKARHDTAPDPATAAARRADLSQAAAVIGPSTVHGVDLGLDLALDLALDCELVVPTTVTSEACAAAAALTRLARPPSQQWRDWHTRFLDRYGVHGLVPVLDAVDAQAGLGYPAGFTGEPTSQPAAGETVLLTARDRRLLELAQRAALRGEHEVVLDDALLEDFAGDPAVELAPTAELTVRVHADSLHAIEAGDFHLSVVRASAQAYSTAGRFLDLFDNLVRDRMATSAAHIPPTCDGAMPAQLTAVTRYTSSLDVNRAAQLLPQVIPIGEYHHRSQDSISLDDIGITADAHRLYLVSISHRRALQPIAVNAVEPVRHAHPLTRFLTEAPAALDTACQPVEWGPAAAGLPFLPALRYGRTLLSPARWHLTAAELPSRKTTSQQWDEALAAWQQTTGCPAEIWLGVGDQAIRLDLHEPAHRALLRDHLNRQTSALLRVVPDSDGWLGGRPHEIVIPLTATGPRPPAPHIQHPPIDVRAHGCLPGGDPRYLKIYARPDEQTTILNDHLPQLQSEVPPASTWWFLRHADPEPHLRLRVSGVPVDTINRWTQQIADADLTRRVIWDTDFPEPGRFGGLAAYNATTAVFAADSAAALAELALTRRHPTLEPPALTAASMVDLVTAVIGNPDEALRWLIDRTRTDRSAPSRHVYDQAIRLANPYDNTALVSMPGGNAVSQQWDARRRVVAQWRDRLPETSPIAPAALLPDLLHLHHARVAGLDLNGERACLHLARAAALSWTTRRTP